MDKESESVEIVNFQPEYANAFRDLNYAWISQLFKIEQADIKVLENPQTSIIDSGGHILLAKLGEKIVGCVALLKVSDSRLELAKMAVTDSVQGHGIGAKLGQAAIETARNSGASEIVLESNSKLKAAISLYRKLGFQEFSGMETPYTRCDIQMRIALKK